MRDKPEADPPNAMIKIVYFDEQSASDYLDICAGGRVASTSKDVRDRTTDLHARVETSLAAKLSWLPFIGTSAEAAAGLGVSSAGQSLLSKTLSNTILTDYLNKVAQDDRVRRLQDLRLTAARDSMAFMKMFTPYMVIAKTDEMGIDLARLDEALERAKGYYELIGEQAGSGKCVLRFNIRAFRNNYGLTDLLRMRLVFHGVRVGQTKESDLGMQAEMEVGDDPPPVSALDLLDESVRSDETLLDVFDVILAGVEHGT